MDAKTERELLDLLKPLTKSTIGLEAEWKMFQDYVQNLAIRGWSRGEIYSELSTLFAKHKDILDTRGCDPLGNYLTSIDGDVAPECFTRFPGEPKDPTAFVHYVRGRKWML